MLHIQGVDMDRVDIDIDRAEHVMHAAGQNRVNIGLRCTGGQQNWHRE